MGAGFCRFSKSRLPDWRIVASLRPAAVARWRTRRFGTRETTGDEANPNMALPKCRTRESNGGATIRQFGRRGFQNLHAMQTGLHQDRSPHAMMPRRQWTDSCHANPASSQQRADAVAATEQRTRRLIRVSAHQTELANTMPRPRYGGTSRRVRPRRRKRSEAPNRSVTRSRIRGPVTPTPPTRRRREASQVATAPQQRRPKGAGPWGDIRRGRARVAHEPARHSLNPGTSWTRARPRHKAAGGVSRRAHREAPRPEGNSAAASVTAAALAAGRP